MVLQPNQQRSPTWAIQSRNEIILDESRALRLSFCRMRPTIILKRSVPGVSDRALAQFAARACNAAGLRGAVTVLVTGNREIQALNARFRKKEHATDVLSFPAPDFCGTFAGDIAISIDVAARNARMLGHSVSEEIRILMLHGILHLAGYDHESDRGEMARRELALRRKLGLPTALIERSSVSRPRRQPVLKRSRV